MTRKITVIYLVVNIALIFPNTSIFANGFKILGVKSTKATAMGEAFIAQADDPTTIAFNPAGITQLKGIQLSNGVTLSNAWIKRKSPTGEKDHNLDKWQAVPSFFITADLDVKDIPEPFAAGLGITMPNGISSEWRQDGFSRYVATFSNLVVVDVAPTIAYQINDELSVGGGINYYYSTASLYSMADYGNLVGLPGTMDGEGRLTADGISWGYNLGVLYNVNKKHSVAATFKSPFEVKYEGTARYDDIPAFVGLGSHYTSSVTTTIQFPAVIVLGYAYRPTDKLKLEVDVDWTNWRSLDGLEVGFENKSLADIQYKYEYENTLAYKFGMEYSLTEKLDLRAGYIYNQNATPEENWRPSLPDTNMHFITSGFGYEVGQFTIEGAMQVVLYEDRTIDNNVDNNETSTASSIDGDYETFALAFSLGVTYKF